MGGMQARADYRNSPPVNIGDLNNPLSATRLPRDYLIAVSVVMAPQTAIKSRAVPHASGNSSHNGAVGPAYAIGVFAECLDLTHV
jgi:hypothetical protein